MKRHSRVHVKKYYSITEDMTYQETWLLNAVNEAGINFTELARKLYISKQTIANYANKKTILSFPVIVAICYVLALEDNPEEVYEAIKKRKENGYETDN